MTVVLQLDGLPHAMTDFVSLRGRVDRQVAPAAGKM
jgi:hypothetical protein